MTGELWSRCQFVVVDVEGNGASPQEIVEVAVVHVRRGRLATERHWMVRPETPITPQATRLHGITNQDVDDRPSFAGIAPDLLAELGSTPVVGHHVGVDAGLLRRQLPGWRPETCIDTLRLAKHALPGASDYGLQALYRSVVGGEESTAHRAPEDARMTARLFLSLASRLGQEMHLDLLALARIGASSEDPLLKAQQGRLFS